MKQQLIYLFKSLKAHPVIDPSISYDDYTPLDLSISNSELKNLLNEAKQIIILEL